MNIGKQILELRRQKNITQEELAAELGVTAAAVSKWENGYTLPDILMLCALADYFEVTTDKLLGRCPQYGLAAIAASSPDLGKQISALAAKLGIATEGIYDDSHVAAAAVKANEQITHLLIGQVGGETPEWKLDWGGRPIGFYLCMSDSSQGVLNNLRKSILDNN